MHNPRNKFFDLRLWLQGTIEVVDSRYIFKHDIVSMRYSATIKLIFLEFNIFIDITRLLFISKHILVISLIAFKRIDPLKKCNNKHKSTKNNKTQQFHL